MIMTVRGEKYFGRDIMVLKSLAEELDIHIIASTGCFAAGNDKHIPKIYYEKTEKEIAEMWIREWKEGIEDSNVKPGIIKIAVDSGPLSSIDKKIVSSACITSLETGLTIACHTGEKECALEVFTVIKKYKLNPSKLILVHADNIEDREVIFSLAEKGCFIEFDWIGLKDINNHVELILESISRGYISQILLSQDAGQYYVGFKDGNRKKFRPYSYIDKYLIPELKKKIDDKDIYIMQVMNPRRALAIE